MDQDRLREVVSALLNENGKTPSEIEKGREAAARLMLKAGVSEDEVLAKTPDMLKEVLESNRMEWLVGQYTSMAIARLSGCKVFHDVILSASRKRTDRKELHFYGYRPDVENALWLHGHILEQAKVQLKAFGIKDRRKKDDFMAAFGAFLATRIHELADKMDVIREEQAEVSSDHALVESKDTAIDDFLKSKFGFSLRDAKGSGRGDMHRDAAEAGREAASNVSLGRPVDGSAKGPLLLS